jgi:hypothetical protein
MLFGQLGHAQSLREITGGLAACEGKLRHLGVSEPPKRSTLSYALLDNNVVDRALKKAFLHRKNFLFYKTLHGAQVGGPLTFKHGQKKNRNTRHMYADAVRFELARSKSMRLVSSDVIEPADRVAWTWRAKSAMACRYALRVF